MKIDALFLRDEGQLDPTFGEGGLVLLKGPDEPGDNISPRGMAVDSAGRFYVCGSIRTSTRRFAYYCVRLKASGAIDPTFGQAGYVIAEFVQNNGGRAYSQINEVVELRDGKLLLIGNYHDGTFNTWKGLIRLHPDGSPDQTFGKSGTVLIALGSIGEEQDDSFGSLHSSSMARTTGNSAILPDGKILLHELIYDGIEETQTAIIRLTPDGVLDPDFNESGIVWVAHPDFTHTQVTDILLADDGKYVLVGNCQEMYIPHARALFTRLHSTGKTDTSFADNGYLLIEPLSGEMNFLMENLVKQTNKRLLGIGYTSDEDDCGLLISRESDGSANIQFNRGKPLLVKLGDRETSWHNACVQKDGSILVYGHLYGPGQVVVAKFTDAGVLDNTFGGGKGWLQFSVSPAGMASALFTDDTLLFFGAATVDGQQVPCVARGLIAQKV
ncbi:hypothetical protein [Pseudomonas sp. NPDC087639]|uniref:hypothetical protein n=1 Tax=Pseudomonas sp. NPDC087639 TaxID=3364445 RepID=UPI00380C54EA